MKKKLNWWAFYVDVLQNLLRIMRWSLFLLVTGIFQAHAISGFGQKTEISLNLKNATVASVLSKIEDNCNFYFMCNRAYVDLDRTISIHADNQPVEKILAEIFKGTDIKYVITGRQIVLTSQNDDSSVLNQVQTRQQKSISGKVADSSGNLLPGVSVVIKSTTTGTITDANGNYTLPNVQSNATLVFSFVGMRSQEILVGAKSVIDVVMQEETIGIEEVVAVGYGTKTRDQLISSISTVGASDLSKASVPNLESALSGRMSGVFSRQTSGEPGRDGADIKIRGFGAALIVVDGIPERNYADLDPNEIESISVLKDAASAAVYGMQGANGVVLVTTKRGKKGDAKLNVSTRYGIQQPYNMPQVTSTEMWQTLLAEYRVNEKLISSRNSVITEDDLIQRTYDYNTNWYDELLKNAPISQSNVNVSGGTDKVKYFFSGGFLHQGGIWNTNSTKKNRFNLRSNVDVNITNALTVSLGMGATINKLDYPGASANSIADLLRSAPYIPVKWPGYDDYYASPTVMGGGNPVALADANVSGYSQTQDRDYSTDFTIEYDAPFLDGLSLKGVAGYNSSDGWSKDWFKNIVYLTYAQDLNQYLLSNSSKETDKAGMLRTDVYNWNLTLQAYLTYKQSFGSHNVNSTVVLEQRQGKNSLFMAGRNDYPSNVLDMLIGGLDNINKTASDYAREFRSRSIIGSFAYDYNTKYLLEFNFRYDGAQYFADKWGFFPSVSAGWFITKENFMKPYSSVLNELKLRGSWGQLGDLSAARNYYLNNEMYYYQSGYKYPGETLTFGDRTLYNPTETIQANPDFTWSKSTMTNIGFDSKFWNGLLSFSTDFFIRDRSGLPAQKAVDNAGILKTWYNLNSDQTRGFEISIGHKNKIGELNYSIDGNFSWARTKAIKVEHGQYTNGYTEWKWNSEGHWTNIRWGYDYIGHYQNQEEINNAPMYSKSKNNSAILPGDLKYTDWNGDGYIDNYDQMPIGRTSYPELMFGATFSAEWRGFDFTMFWQGGALSQFKLGIFDTQAFRQGQTEKNVWAYFVDRWRKVDYTDPNSEWIAGKYPAIRDYFSPNINGEESNFWNNQGSYLRLKNIEFGYTIPKSITNKIDISNLRIYVSAYNLLTFSANKYIDPEQREGDWTMAGYPQIRSFNCGLSLNF